MTRRKKQWATPLERGYQSQPIEWHNASLTDSFLRKGKMRAIQFTQHGDYQQLHLVNIPRPEPAQGEVLLKMQASAVNPIDDAVRLGQVPGAKEPPHIPGVEGVGTIVASNNPDFPAGKRFIVRVGIMGSRGFGVWDNGVWQEYVTAPTQEFSLFPAPDTISDAEAAGIASGYLVALYSLMITGEFQAGQTVLAPAVGGTVGNAVVQAAQALGASLVITTDGSTAKVEQAKAAGYTNVIDLSQEALDKAVMRLTDGKGVNLVIDSVGGRITGQALKALAQGGKIVIPGYAGGTEANIGITDVVFKEAQILGLNLLTRPPELIVKARDMMLRLANEGKIKPLVNKTFPLEEAASAQQYLMESRPFGRVILTL